MATKKVPVLKKRPYTKRAEQKFLQGLSEGLTVKDAAELTGLGVSTFYERRKHDPELAELWAMASDIGTDVIEREAFRRAVEGWEEKVYGRVAPGIDGVVGTQTKYSDRLMEVLLKGRRPQYKDNQRIDLSQTHVSVSLEDRSASLEQIAKVLREVGVSPDEIVTGHSRLTSGADLPVIEGVLAEPSDVQPEASSVPAAT